MTQYDGPERRQGCRRETCSSCPLVEHDGGKVCIHHGSQLEQGRMRDERIRNLRGIGLWLLGTLGGGVALYLSLTVPYQQQTSRDLAIIRTDMATFLERIQIQRGRIERIESAVQELERRVK